MRSAVLNKPPSPITFVYCFLLISFLFYISHRIVTEHVNNGNTSVHGSPLKHDSNAARRGSPPKQSSPTQNNPNSVTPGSLNAGRAVVNCGRGKSYRSCLPGTSRSTESDAPMYNWVKGETPSYNRGGGLYQGRH